MTGSVESMVSEKVMARFETLIQRDRLAHAYLFIGPAGSGKTETALAVAKRINCERPAQGFCSTCHSCLMIASGNHPDVLVYDQGEEMSIKIQKVRDLIQKVQLRPYEANRKVVIVRNADALTIEGANALLKTLEEPTASSILILTTAVPERILDTVKSRCHAIRFFGHSRRVIASRLVHADIVSEKDASVLAGYADGCYGKARQWRDQGFLERRDEIVDRFLLAPADEAVMKSVTADQEKTRLALGILYTSFRDLILLKAGVSEKNLANQDRIKEFKMLSERYTSSQLRDVLDVIVDTKKMLDSNLNIKIPLLLLKEKIWISN